MMPNTPGNLCTPNAPASASKGAFADKPRTPLSTALSSATPRSPSGLQRREGAWQTTHLVLPATAASIYLCRCGPHTCTGDIHVQIPCQPQNHDGMVAKACSETRISILPQRLSGRKNQNLEKSTVKIDTCHSYLTAKS